MKYCQFDHYSIPKPQKQNQFLRLILLRFRMNSRWTRALHLVLAPYSKEHIVILAAPVLGIFGVLGLLRQELAPGEGAGPASAWAPPPATAHTVPLGVLSAANSCF